MGMEVLEGLRVSQSQQRPLPRKIMFYTIMLCMFIYVLCIAMRALYRTLAKVYIKLNLNLNPRKINKRINSHPVSTLAKKRIDRLRLEHLALLCGNKDLTFPSSPYQRCFGRDRRKICVCLGEDL